MDGYIAAINPNSGIWWYATAKSTTGLTLFQQLRLQPARGDIPESLWVVCCQVGTFLLACAVSASISGKFAPCRLRRLRSTLGVCLHDGVSNPNPAAPGFSRLGKSASKTR
jgi:hypothetical protein